MTLSSSTAHILRQVITHSSSHPLTACRSEVSKRSGEGMAATAEAASEYLVTPLPVHAPYDPGSDLHHGSQLGPGDRGLHGRRLSPGLLEDRGTAGRRAQVLLSVLTAGPCQAKKQSGLAKPRS